MLHILKMNKIRDLIWLDRKQYQNFWRKLLKHAGGRLTFLKRQSIITLAVAVDVSVVGFQLDIFHVTF